MLEVTNAKQLMIPDYQVELPAPTGLTTAGTLFLVDAMASSRVAKLARESEGVKFAGNLEARVADSQVESQPTTPTNHHPLGCPACYTQQWVLLSQNAVTATGVSGNIGGIREALF